MHVDHDRYPDHVWHFEETDGPQNTSISDEELMRLQLDILRNFTQLYGSSAIDKGQTSFDVLRHPFLRIVVVSIFVVVIGIGVLSSAAVLYAVTTIRRSRTVSSILIGNLAASDLWHCAFCLPIQLHYQLTDRWVFGAILCRAMFASFAVPLYSSSLSVVWIAVDRYRLIICPLKRHWSASVAGLMITTSIFISVIISIPVIHFTSLHRIDDDLVGIHKSFCVEDWPSTSARRLYSLVVFAIQFCLPLLATTALYLRIYRRLRSRRAARKRRDRDSRRASTTVIARATRTEEVAMHRGSGSGRKLNCFPSKTMKGDLVCSDKTGSGRKSPLSGGHQGRTSRLLALIIVNFVAFWLPWNVLSLVVEFDRTAVPVDLFRLLDLGLKVLALAGSACVNPILYCWSNDNIRGELMASIDKENNKCLDKVISEQLISNK